MDCPTAQPRMLHGGVDRLRLRILRALAFVGPMLLAAACVAQPPQNVDPPANPASPVQMPSLWDLAVQGGWFMIPIGIASVVTMVFTMERLVGLRKARILPRDLINVLRSMITESSVTPQKLYEASGLRHSPLARVVKAAVLKAGRPLTEVEKSVEDAVEREIATMTRNLRPINVVASISPLIGLLGTVQGMIMAFMVTSTTSSTGTAKAQELAHGIYTALVTTFAGLLVAVVSVVLANYLEGKIERLLRQMEAIFLDLLPHLERFEGRMRVSEVTGPNGVELKLRSLEHAPAEGEASTNRIAASRKPRSQKRPATDGKSVSGVNEKIVTRKPGPSTLRSNFDS
ncbi:MAG: MotA/TolQ/ExbB proton channel family protein [Planctomycetaceae bacterium]|nr:MotA/TolQ/ExbB proton channel family protein [Planctomycetaceae bacterium]